MPSETWRNIYHTEKPANALALLDLDIQDSETYLEDWHREPDSYEKVERVSGLEFKVRMLTQTRA
eukprot:8746636-Prorocentrum_lima.AAC.1